MDSIQNPVIGNKSISQSLTDAKTNVAKMFESLNLNYNDTGTFESNSIAMKSAASSNDYNKELQGILACIQTLKQIEQEESE